MRREKQNKTKEMNMNMTKNEMANYFARVFLSRIYRYVWLWVTSK